jgi:hypothetical protein
VEELHIQKFLDSFHPVRILGEGFGKVILVKKKASDGSDQHSAINVMKKSHIVSSCSVTYTVAVKEPLVLDSGIHLRVLRHSTRASKTKEHLFFVLEYVSGGNMAEDLENVRVLSEERSQVYAVEITLALEFLHRYDNLHRVYTYDNMAQYFSNVVKAYQEETILPFVPKGSFGLTVVGADGFPTTLFFEFFFSDHEKGIQFLQEYGPGASGTLRGSQTVNSRCSK